jgi:AAA family ATP:ADP antiporter
MLTSGEVEQNNTVSDSHPGKLNRAERVLRLLTIVRAGEGRCILLFSAHAFLIMAAYYLVKALRESFLLSQSGAEVRSYAVALNGLVLMALVPLYSALRRVVSNSRLVVVVTLFFAANMVLFLLVYPLRAPWFGVIFFVWVGVFGLVLIAQFWALAAGAFNTKSGQRLFPAIMLGATLGALAGAQVTDMLIANLGALALLGIGALVTTGTAALVGPELAAIPAASASRVEQSAPHTTRSLAGGFRVVFSDRYLLLVALFVVLLNCISSMGDFLLADLVQKQAATSGLDATAREAFIGGFYARFHFWMTLLGVALQMFVVSRVYRAIGVRGAVLVLPVMALFVYGAIAFVPIFSVIWLAKVLETATNYSLMNTTQQALYLPTSPVAKYDGKMTIDTFFWRFGDVVQAGLVYVGLNQLGFTMSGFAVTNTLLSAAWVALAVAIGWRYVALFRTEVSNTAPVRLHGLSDCACRSGEPLEHALAADAFYDADPGDVLRFAAQLNDGEPLPEWLAFDEECGIFTGTPPEHAPERLSIQVTAIDVDGARVSAVFMMVRHA